MPVHIHSYSEIMNENRQEKKTFLQYGTTKVKDASWMTSSISPLDGKLRAKMCGAICLKICALLTQDQSVSVL